MEQTGTANATILGVPKYAVGVLATVLVTVLWISSAFLTKTILKDFNKPFFLTYLCLISFQLYYVFLLVRDPLDSRPGPAGPARGAPPGTGRPRTPVVPSRSPVFVGQPAGRLPPATLQDMARYGAVLFPLYCAAEYLINLSYQSTAVSSATIISSTNGLFLLVLGVLFGIDRATLCKALCAGLTLGGAAVLVLGELVLGSARLRGNVMALASAGLHAAYAVGLHRLSTDPARVSIPLLFAVVGTCTMVCAWPLFILLHVTGVEPFVWPTDLASWASILVNVLLGSVLPSYLWNVAFLLSGPLVVAVGMSFAVPATVALEYANSGALRWPTCAAGCLVLAGLLLINTVAVAPGGACG